MAQRDFLLEIGTEELPPKQLLSISNALANALQTELDAHALRYTTIKSYATPRRLATLVMALADTQDDRIIERRGPAWDQAFTAAGAPTEIAHKFAASCGVDIAQLTPYENNKRKWVLAKITKAGEATSELLPKLVNAAIAALPLAKTMRWGNNHTAFVRPVHWIAMIYGEQPISGTVLGMTAENITYGHRFHHPQPMILNDAVNYETTLETTGYVIADFEQRRTIIRSQLEAIAIPGKVLLDEDCLEEVTGLVEWPEILLGKFAEHYLRLPRELLITILTHQQRCFPLLNSNNELCSGFAAVSNIQSKDPQRVIAGNERVIKARLADADFFYHADRAVPLDDYANKLKGVVFQDKLGTLYDKTLRLMASGAYLAQQLNLDLLAIKRAAQLAKADLTTSMIGEFPELQGIMGSYYALAQNEPAAVAVAIKEHYLPRFAQDVLPQTPIGAALAITDRVDTLVGLFGINKLPTGEKDPLGLRRAALGIIRNILEHHLNFDMLKFLQIAQQNYAAPLGNANAATQVLAFLYERLRHWYDEQNINLNTFNAVLALCPTNLWDFDKRVKSVEYFRGLPAAIALSGIHKRINNILTKNQVTADLKFNAELLQEPAEKNLHLQLAQKSIIIQSLCEKTAYPEALLELVELKPAVDAFFDHVMVMAEDAQLRTNRLALLLQLRELFRTVAEISLLYAVCP